MAGDSVFSKMFAKLFGGSTGDNTIVIDKATGSLAESVTTILADDKLDDVAKGAAMAATFEEFSEHLKSTLTAGPAVVKKEGESEMDLKALAKALGLPETATEADVTAAIAKNMAQTAALATNFAKMEGELRISKADFTAGELEFYNKMAGTDDDSATSDVAKKAFRLANHADRTVTIKAAAPPLPAYVQKLIDDNASMAKRLADIEAGGDLTALAKKAAEIGLPETEAATIQKAMTGDKDAVNKLLDFVKQATAVAKAGGVFKEFGSSTGTGVVSTPYDELVELSKAVRKADPKLSEAQAFTKVYEDPANAEIVRRERAANTPAAA